MTKGSLQSVRIPNPNGGVSLFSLQRGGGKISPVIGTVSIAAIFAALTWIAGHNFLTFHSLAELFSITVAAAVFVIAWNVRDTIDNGYLEFLGISLLFIAAIDLAHMLAYGGMGVFPGYCSDLPTQLWIAGRTMEAISLLIAPGFLSRRLKPLIAFTVYSFVTSIVFLTTFVWKIFPVCYVDGQGLTSFKIYAEYGICIVLVLALSRLFAYRSRFQRSTLLLLYGSILATILSEFAFTQYASVYGSSNIIGHLLKIASVLLVYKAIVETGFRRPYELLYRNLAESERKFRSAIESNMIGVVFANPITGKVTEANDEYLRIIGRTRSELEAGNINWKVMTPAEFLPWEENAFTQQDFGPKNVPSFEKEYIRPDGSHVPVIFGGAYLDDAHSRMVAFVLDNTARKQAEEALLKLNEELEQRIAQRTAEVVEASERIQAERKRFLDVLESLPVMITLIRPDYHVPFSNRAFREALGESGGRKCYEYQFGRTTPCVECQAFIPLQTMKPHHWQWELPTGRIFDIYNTHFIDADGAQMILEMDIDITDRTHAEEELENYRHRLEELVTTRTAQLEAENAVRREAEEQLKQLNESLEKRVEERTAEAEQRSRQLRQLAADLTLSEQRERQRLAMVLHDGLQQTLVAAKYSLAVLGRGGNIKEQAAEVSSLIDDSIHTSRSLTAELSPPILYKGGLVPALKWLAKWMREKHGLAVQLSSREPINPIPEEINVLLFQSARELLFNVVKHAGVKEARIEVHQEKGLLEVIVSDNGSGFDLDHLNSREDRTTGMGLFSIRERLSYLGGRMEIESRRGRGSRFRLITPASAAALKESAIASPPDASVRMAPSPTGSENAAKPIRVVLVDDHMVMRQGLAGLLQTAAGIEVIGEASDGQSAVDLIRKVRPDVVLMDINMPGMDGIQATRILHPEMPDIKIIGLSMFSEGDQAAAIRDAGAVDYVTKSGPSEAVVEAIRKSALSCVS